MKIMKIMVCILMFLVAALLNVSCCNIQRDNELIKIDSYPSSEVFVNEQSIGTTPLDYSFSYTKVSSTFGSDKNIPQNYVIRFKNDQHYDEFVYIKVPSSGNTDIKKDLIPRGLILDIKCNIKIEARSSYFQQIEEILSNDRYTRNFQAYPMELIQGQETLPDEQKTYRKQYQFEAISSSLFDEMVSQLKTTAKKKNYVFESVSAKYEIDFASTGISLGIKHVITANIRLGADLYLVLSDGLKKIDSEGRTKVDIVVELSKGAEFVYMITKYKTAITYKRVNIYTKEENELTKDAMLSHFNISREEFDKWLQTIQ